MEVVIATHNKDKFREIYSILRDVDIAAKSLDDFPGAPKVKENGKTLVANAKKKAIAIARFTGRLALADDTGLVVDALAGAPGVYSARFAGKNATYEKNCRKLLRLLRDVPWKKRRARFVCCVAAADPYGVVGVVHGRHNGYITSEEKGRYGFGYDPVFYSSSAKKTFAELKPAEKNTISHRSEAFRKAKKVVMDYIRKKAEKRSVGKTGEVGVE